MLNTTRGRKSTRQCQKRKQQIRVTTKDISEPLAPLPAAKRTPVKGHAKNETETESGQPTELNPSRIHKIKRDTSSKRLETRYRPRTTTTTITTTDNI